MNLIRLHAGGSPAVDVVFVALLAVWQRGDCEGGAALRGVFGTEESCERFVGGNDVSIDGVCDLPGQALLVFSRDVRRILLCRLEERVGVDDALTLDGQLLQEKSHGHELVLYAGAKDFGGLAEDARDLVKAGNVVFVVLDRVERNGQRQIRQAGMDAILLVDWHLELFEVEVGDTLFEDTSEEVVRELVLIGEAGTRSGFKAGKEGLVSLVTLEDGVE